MILNVLIVEDQPIMAFLIKKILENYRINAGSVKISFVVYSTRNGQEALSWLSVNKAQIITTDETMPIMRGIPFIQKVRESDKIIPIMLVTALTDLNTKTLALDAGVTKIFNKPIRSEQDPNREKMFIKEFNELVVLAIKSYCKG